MKKVWLLLLIIFFLLGLVYILAPGPKSIDYFPALPGSLKSNEPGDTYQNPNTTAYFSDVRRKEATRFYKTSFEHLEIFGLKLPSIRLNHPPENSFTYIRDQQLSTYLEEYLYPLRESLFVNGYEPFDENGKPFHRGITNIFINGKFYQTKTTIKYYPSSVYFKLIIYLAIWVALIAFVKVLTRSIKEN